MLSKVASCAKTLVVTGEPRKKATIKGVRRLANKFGPVNPSRYGSKMMRGMAMPDMKPKDTSEKPGELFDVANSPFEQRPAPSGPISTQGLNRQGQHLPPSHVNPSAQSDSSSTYGNATKPTASLRPKKLSRVADTDWQQVTTEADTKYFYNAKTGETATQLPPSVIAHIGRILGKAENDAVARNPAKLPPNLQRSSVPSSSSASPTGASGTSATSGPSRPPSHVSASSASRNGASAVRSSSAPSTISASAATAPNNAIEQAEIDPSSFPPIAAAKTTLSSSYSPLLSVREPLQTQFGSKPENMGDDGSYRFEFTQVEKDARLASLREEYYKETGMSDFEMSEEELDDIMQEEANEAVQEDDPELDIPAYYSRVTGKSKKSKSASNEDLDPLAKLAKTQIMLAELADQHFGRAKFGEIIGKYGHAIKRLDEMVKNGTGLNLREELVYLANSHIVAKAQILDHRWAAAKQTIANMKQVNVDHPYTLLAEAQQHIGMSEIPEAVRAINKALDGDPGNIPAMLTLAEAYFEVNDIATCEEVARDVLKLDKTNYKALLLLSRAIALQGDLTSSDKYAQRAILSNGKRPEAYVQEARLLFQAGQHEAGLSAINKALECDEEYVEAYTLLGNVFVEKGMAEDAERAFLAALKQHGGSVEALIGLGVINYNKENWPRLLELASKATVLDPGAIEAWFHKGRAELELKHFQMAVASFERCVSFDSDAEEPYLYLGVSLHGAGRTAECVARMDQLLVRHPESVKARVNKALALQTMGKYDDAMNLLNEAVRIDPIDIEAKMARVTLLMATGKTEEAQTYYATFQNEATVPAFEAAKQAASQSYAADQARQNASPGPEMTEDEIETAKLEQEAIRATDESEEAMKFAPTPEELSSLSVEQIQAAMNSTDIPNLSSADIMAELQQEMDRVNGVLGKVGLPSMSLDGEISNEYQAFDASEATPEALQEYASMMQELHAKASATKMPDPKSPDELDLASSLGLTPDMIATMNAAMAKSPLQRIDEAERQVVDEEDKKLYEWMERTMAAHRSKKAKKGSETPL